jgi:hypothetical protein
LLVNKSNYASPEVFDEFLEQLIVSIEAFQRNLAAAFDVINAQLETHCRNRTFFGVTSLCTAVCKRQALEQHLLDGHILFVDCSCYRLVHFNNLELLFLAHETKDLEYITRVARKGHVHFEHRHR